MNKKNKKTKHEHAYGSPTMAERYVWFLWLIGNKA